MFQLWRKDLYVSSYLPIQALTLVLRCNVCNSHHPWSSFETANKSSVHNVGRPTEYNASSWNLKITKMLSLLRCCYTVFLRSTSRLPIILFVIIHISGVDSSSQCIHMSYWYMGNRLHCCLFGRELTRRTWWRHQMETFSALLAICAGNSPVPGEFPAQRPVTRSFDVFFHLRLNKRLSKQS